VPTLFTLMDPPSNLCVPAWKLLDSIGIVRLSPRSEQRRYNTRVLRKTRRCYCRALLVVRALFVPLRRLLQERHLEERHLAKSVRPTRINPTARCARFPIYIIRFQVAALCSLQWSSFVIAGRFVTRCELSFVEFYLKNVEESRVNDKRWSTRSRWMSKKRRRKIMFMSFALHC